MTKELTAKQQRFVDEYLIDLNATAAAKRAGYADSTAEKKAPLWVGGSRDKSPFPHVWDAVQKAKQERAERTQIDADWLLMRLAAEVEADLADLYTEDGTLKPVHEWPLIWRQGLVAGIDVSEEFEWDNGKKEPTGGQIIKIKGADRARRLEMIGRHVSVQAFRDNVDHTGTITQVNMTPEDYKKARAEMLENDDC